MPRILSSLLLIIQLAHINHTHSSSSSPMPPHSSHSILSPTQLSKVAMSLGLRPEEIKEVSSRRIQSLWAGYGQCDRLVLESLNKPGLSVVVKSVSPPSRGGHEEHDVGHMRKLKSYVVEAAFYTAVAPRLRESLALPRPLLVEISAEDGNLKLVLEDLSLEFPRSASGGRLTRIQTEAALKWLAKFHACTWELGNGEAESGVWEQGCYWHLSTRLEELSSIGPCSPWQPLALAAPAIDRRIRGLAPSACSSQGPPSKRFMSLVHGDAKAANLVFSAGKEVTCAAYDLQYVGRGLGLSDVVMLLVSSAEHMDQEEERHFLSEYAAQLRGALGDRAGQAPTEEQVSLMYEICLLDYVRFMAGWGFWGNEAYAQGRAMQAMQALTGGSDMSAEDFEREIYRRYPLVN